MAVEFSLAERNRIANNLFGGAGFTIKAYSNTISASGTGGTELTADGYEPIAVTNNTTNFPLASTGTRSNAVEFSVPFEEDALIKSIGIFKTSDNTFLARKVYATELEILSGQSWRFPIGSITFTPTNPS